MFRHVVMFRWAIGIDADALSRALDELRRLPERVPEVRAFTVGVDAGIAADNHDCVVVADFDDRAAYERYAAHPVHRALVSEHLRPLLAARSAVQHDLD